jgi:UDP-glucose 4-epimerase
MANMINELTGNPEGIVYASRRDWDTKTRLLSSIEKAQKILIYKPHIKFKYGLTKTYEWFDENWDRIEKNVEF